MAPAPNAIRLVRSNRAEVLVDALSERLETPLDDPFARECIVVQGRGMATWLSMQLSQAQGVWAHCDYLYPRHFVQRIFQLVSGENDPPPSYDRDKLTWAIAAQLPEHLHQPAFTALRRYIGEDDGTRRFMLAARIAEAFDEYLTYRPDLLRSWEQRASRPSPQLSLWEPQQHTDAALWQQTLWLAVVAQLGAAHTAAMEQTVLRSLRRRRAIAGLPNRISIFMLSNLPPMYVRLLAALSGHSEISLYLLSPSQEYFADIASAHRDVDLVASQENRLLKTFGMLGAQFFKVQIEEFEAARVAEIDIPLYREAPESTMLGRLHNDLLHFIDRPRREQLPFDPEDTSIRVHACHSRIREVEVLHDQLLELVHEQKIAPERIVVMTPNIEDYAPLIEAVFHRPSTDARFLPHRISDRGLRHESSVLEAFLRVLDLAASRVTAAEVLDLLTLAPVHQRFEIPAASLEVLTTWVVESGIRWGMDADHRATFSLPRDDQNTWRFGLDRMLLGYAFGPSDGELVGGVLPFEEIEGQRAQLLGRFSGFVRVLFEHLESLGEARPPGEWQPLLLRLCSDLLATTPDNAWEHQHLAQNLQQLVQDSEQANFTGVLPFSVVRTLLERRLSDAAGARGFLAGGVTFCAMVPMRSVPFDVVCLLGLNDGDFPRDAFRAEFNLLEHGSAAFRLGDPDRRSDDRYLFLEAILSARQQLYLSYVGQSIRDNSQLSPAIVVTELLEYLQEQYAGDDSQRGAAVLQHLVVHHPLQPFSSRYFDGSHAALFSYESGYIEGARASKRSDSEPMGLFDARLPEPPLEHTLLLDDLIRFFRSPAAYLLQKRLGVYLEEVQREIPDREPLELVGLDQYRAGEPMLKHHLAARPPAQSWQLLSATGLFPAGALGRYEFEKLKQTVWPIAQAVEQLCCAGDLNPERVRVALGDGRSVVGEIQRVGPLGIVHVQFSRVHPKHRLALWIQHLIWCASCPNGSDEQRQSWLIGRVASGIGSQVIHFAPVSDASRRLDELVQYFDAGQAWPLAFFPSTSYSFAHALNGPKGTEQSAMREAQRSWDNELALSEALRRVYGENSQMTLDGPATEDGTPFENDLVMPFSRLAVDIISPLLAHQEEHRFVEER